MRRNIKKKSDFIEKEIPLIITFFVVSIIIGIMFGWEKKPEFGLHLLKYLPFGILVGIIGYLGFKFLFAFWRGLGITLIEKEPEDNTIIGTETGFLLKENEEHSDKPKFVQKNSLKEKQKKTKEER